MRAIAVIAVVLFHAGLLPGGYLGVDVFFVLSGFLISGILIAEVERTGTISLSNFWARRARRLLPAAAVVTLAILALGAFLVSPNSQLSNARTGVAFAVYSSNLLFTLRSASYFGRGLADDPLLHSWSLSVEEQFYLVFAPLLLLLAYGARTQGAAVFRKRFVGATVVVGMISLLLCLAAGDRFATAAFYLLPTRAWEFAIGALAVLAVRSAPRSDGVAVVAVAVFCVAALLFSTAFVGEGAAHPGAVTLVPTIATAGLLISGGMAPSSSVSRMLGVAPMRLIGRLSYSWYLWHWPLLAFLSVRNPEASTWTQLALGLASLIPAAITYSWVESPIRHSRKLQPLTRATLWGAGALSFLVLSSALLARMYARGTLSREPYASIERSRDNRVGLERDGCDDEQLHLSPERCVFGATASDTTVVLLGDSHARHWFPALERIAERRSWKLIPILRSGCPITPSLLESARRELRAECAQWRADALRRVREIGPELIFLANLARPRVNETQAEYVTELRGVLRELSTTGATVALLRDSAWPGYNVPDCLQIHHGIEDRCAFPIVEGARDLVARLQRRAIRDIGGVVYLDLLEEFCGRQACPAARNGMVRYSDHSHMTAAFAASLAPALEQRLGAAIGGGSGRD